jgi:hypothetical protein
MLGILPPPPPPVAPPLDFARYTACNSAGYFARSGDHSHVPGLIPNPAAAFALGGLLIMPRASACALVSEVRPLLLSQNESSCLRTTPWRLRHSLEVRLSKTAEKRQ